MLNSVNTPGLELAGGPSPQDAYRMALRHSVRVRRLKVLLPVFARDVFGGDAGTLGVIWGAAGSGKSALVARAAQAAQQAHPQAAVICRFIGATPGSSNGRSLLEGLCRELAPLRAG